MKTLTCNQLGGACELVLQGETFEIIGQASRAHVMSLIQQGDKAHQEAMEKMMQATPEQQQAMMMEYKTAFDVAADI